MMAHPIVYGSAGSSHVWSARLALAEKGVTHELVDVPFGAHREQLHLSRQPFAKVPGFEDDGFALYETQAIMRYVDERFRSKSAGARSRGCASTSTEHKDALEGVPALYPGS
jgi:glutathione S-transferase